MIIVKQDKKGKVNLNNVTDIYIDREEDGNRFFVFYIPVSNIDGLDILGIYETEERAKEVLQEIIERYTNWNNLVCGQPRGFCSPKYEMPEK